MPGRSARSASRAGQDVGAVERAASQLDPGGELVEVPAQAVLDRGVRWLDQIVAVIHEQAQLAFGTVQSGDGQVGLAQGRPGDGEGVDRIALAGLAARTAAPRP